MRGLLCHHWNTTQSILDWWLICSDLITGWSSISKAPIVKITFSVFNEMVALRWPIPTLCKTGNGGPPRCTVLLSNGAVRTCRGYSTSIYLSNRQVTGIKVISVESENMMSSESLQYSDFVTIFVCVFSFLLRDRTTEKYPFTTSFRSCSIRL